MEALSIALGEPVSAIGPIGGDRGRASRRIEIRTPTRHLVVKRSDDAEEVALDALLATIVCSRWFRQPLGADTLDLVLRDLATWAQVRGA